MKWFIMGFTLGIMVIKIIDVVFSRKSKPVKERKVSIDTYTKLITTLVVAHGMLLTSWSYVLAWKGLDTVADVSTTIVTEIIAPVITYLATNTIMNIFEKNKLSFSVPINSTVINDGKKISDGSEG
jgi:hypothetical protein